MSLAGNLEDLGLGEILQIVSLSRKTGVLAISSAGRNGSVFFRNGQVVRASSSIYQQGLGVVLIQKGIIDPAILRRALVIQQENGFSERLGGILIRHFAVAQEIIEEVVRDQIEKVVFSFFTWSNGEFKFEAHDEIDTVDDAAMDPLQFMLDQGLNPQFLAIEGARILDEKRNSSDGGLLDDYGADNLGGEFDKSGNTDIAEPAPAAQQTIVLVDDDGPSLRAIADALREHGFIVHAMTCSEDTLSKVDTLHRSGVYPFILIDLIMPKMDGSGVLGGIELLELLHEKYKMLPMVVVSDYHHAEAEKIVLDLGCDFLIKPRRVEIGDLEILQKFVARLCDKIHNTPVANKGKKRYNLGDELRIEIGDDDDQPLSPDNPVPVAGLSLLKGMLEELNNPDLQGGVMLLILRFASEFFNRAIYFSLADNIISGAGQFGISGGQKNGDELIRSIHLPLEAASIFRDSLKGGRAAAFKPAFTPLDRSFLEQLGGGFPDEIFVGPVQSQSRIIGFLYGDNLPDKHPLGEIEALQIFLSQAGIIMEKSLLERQMHERTSV